MTGAWYWDGPSTLYFRPRNYWPQHTRVRFVGHLNGVEGAPGVYGAHTLRQSFVIGRSLIAVADTDTHRVHVYLNRRLLGNWPMSSGKPGDDTPNGTYLTIEKQNPAEMKGPGYDIMVPYSVRFTWSGAYLHDAFWSVGSQGFANVSHGCVNLSPEHAITYYNLSVPGRPGDDHRQPARRDVGQRLDGLVPELARPVARQRAPHGGEGGPERKQVRSPHVTATVESQTPARQAAERQRRCDVTRSRPESRSRAVATASPAGRFPVGRLSSNAVSGHRREPRASGGRRCRS